VVVIRLALARVERKRATMRWCRLPTQARRSPAPRSNQRRYLTRWLLFMRVDTPANSQLPAASGSREASCFGRTRHKCRLRR
jgi:hypothetical protein